METGARRLRSGKAMQEAILCALAGGPLSSREIFICVSGTATARRALKALLMSGRVVQWGCRVTFDFGKEPLFEKSDKRAPRGITYGETPVYNGL